MIRRFGAPPLEGQNYLHRPGAYVIAHHADRILMTFQSAPEPEIQLPGGGIDPGESPIQAAHREVLEETGWRITRLRKLGCFRRFVFMPEYDIMAEKLCHIFTAKPVLQLCEPLEPDHTVDWLPIDQAVQQVANPGDAHFLRRAFKHL